MPYRSMDILELSRFLGMDLRKLEKMAQRGEIPCLKVGGQWRFNRAEVTEWLQQQLGDMSHEHLADVEAGISAHREADPRHALVTAMLRPEAMSVHLAANTRKSVLKELVGLAEQTGLVYDGEQLVADVEAREELCSTAMEGGVAIPHPRRPLPYAIAEPMLVVAHTVRGIGFNAPDGRLTDLFFLTCSQDDRYHLHVLARLCRMLRDPEFAYALREAATVEVMMDVIHDREQAVIANSA